MVKAVEPITIVRIHLTNSGNILVAEVPVKDSRACVEGDLCIDGCPGSGARITLDWSDTAGAFTGKLLPTGNPTDIITVDGKDYEVSLVDCANPLVFIRAQSLGMKGNESAAEIDANKELCATIEKIRSHAAVIFGLVDKPEDASRLSPYNPFFSIVSEPSDYVTPDGKQIKKEDVDIKERNILQVFVNFQDQLMVGDSYLSVDQLRDKAKEFIANPNDDEKLPEKVAEEVPFFGTQRITKNHVISLRCDRGTSYKTYIAVQNELVAAYNELRDELAQSKWQVNYADLNESQQEAIRKIYPQVISEAEPKKYGEQK